MIAMKLCRFGEDAAGARHGKTRPLQAARLYHAHFEWQWFSYSVAHTGAHQNIPGRDRYWWIGGHPSRFHLQGDFAHTPTLALVYNTSQIARTTHVDMIKITAA